MKRRTFLRTFAQMMGACAVTPLVSQTAFAAGETNTAATELAAASVTRPTRQTWSFNVFRAAGYDSECTSYALDRMHEATGLWMKVRGSAYKWANEARLAGWTVSKIPEINSVLVMQSPPGYRYEVKGADGVAYKSSLTWLGHVAWVEKISSGWVYVHDKNWRRGRVGSRWINIVGAPVDFIYSHR